MKQIPTLIFAIGLLASCSQEANEPTFVFEGSVINFYNQSSEDQVFSENWYFLQPDIDITNTTDIKTYFDPTVEDKIIFTVKGNYGILNISTRKKEITNYFDVEVKTLTFHEGEYEYYGRHIIVKKDGIYVDGELNQALNNCQMTKHHYTLFDSQTKDVQTTFTGETKQANLESFTVSQGIEEYKLTYVSPTSIDVYQIQPTDREIGTIDRN